MKQEHIDQVKAAVAAAAERVQAGRAKRIYFVACGGSQASMMPARYLFDREANIPAAIYTANEFNYATPSGFDADTIVVTCSHSGTTPETVAAAQKATDEGALSIAFSNAVDSPLWKAAEFPIHYDHGDEAVDSDKCGALMLRLWFELMKLFDADNAARWDAGINSIEKLAEVKKAASDLYRDRAVAFASENKRATTIYTMGSGANYGEMYSLAICLFMEMQWINSNCIHSGEYFHGPFEVTDYDVPFVITVGNGATRHLDERALAFAKKFSDRLFVIDENDFDFGDIDESVREYLAPEVLSAVVRVMVDALAHDRGHALSVRRYMWQMEY